MSKYQPGDRVYVDWLNPEKGTVIAAFRSAFGLTKYLVQLDRYGYRFIVSASPRPWADQRIYGHAK